MPSEVNVIVTNAVGQPAIDISDASVTLSSEEADIPRLPVELMQIGAAHWTGSVTIPAPGTWLVTTHLRVGEIRDEVLTGTITIAP